MKMTMRATRLAAISSLVLLFMACQPDLDRGGSASAVETPPAVKATDAAGRAPTATPIPVAKGQCPAILGDPGVCSMSVELLKAGAAAVPLEPLTITCPPSDRWVLAVEPSCSRVSAGQRQSGFAIGAKVFSFVNESGMRSALSEWLSPGLQIGGIGCPRESESASLDCSKVFTVLLLGTPGKADPVLLFAWSSSGGPRAIGVRTGIATQPERVAGGGWIDTTQAGLEEVLPSRVWMVPWSP